MPQWVEDLKTHKAAWVGVGIGGLTLLIAYLAYRHQRSATESAAAGAQQGLPVPINGGTGVGEPGPPSSGNGDIIGAMSTQSQAILDALQGLQGSVNALEPTSAHGGGAGQGDGSGSGASGPMQFLTVRAPGSLPGAEAYDASNAARGVPLWSPDRSTVIGYGTYGQVLQHTGNVYNYQGGPGTEFGSKFFEVLINGVKALVNAADVAGPPATRTPREVGASANIIRPDFSRGPRGAPAQPVIAGPLPPPTPWAAAGSPGAGLPMAAGLHHAARRID